MSIDIPKPVLYGLGIVLGIAAVVGITLAVSGGGGGDDGAQVVTVTQDSAETGTSDGGTIDTAIEETPEEPAGPADCDEAGINREEGNTGTCLQGKQEFVVADKDGTVKMDQLEGRLNGIEATETLDTDYGNPTPKAGVFLVVNLAVKNTTSQPQTFNSTGDIAALLLCNDVYTENFNAANSPGINSWVWSSSNELQPNTEQSGTLIFDVPVEAVDCLEKDGNLQFGNFRDDFGFSRPKQVGTIRTYQ